MEFSKNHEIRANLINIDKHSFFVLALAIITGILIGSIAIPLPGGGSFSLGNSGGPLLSGLIISHFGLNAGNGFVEILVENGISLLFFGALITAIPMFVSYFIGRKLLKMDLMKSLGSICGGMTSTPALGTLLNVSDDGDSVTSAYAMTYPIALVCVILSCQIIALFF